MFGFAGLHDDAFGRLHTFAARYSCFSVSMYPSGDKRSLEDGGKIILPPSALDTLTKLNVVYPMLFKLINPKTNTSTHCGVLEFVADEGHMYIPYWMMRNLLIDEGEELRIESVNLPVATFSRFEPQSPDFLADISNPKAALEYALRRFACLTKGDVVAIAYNDKVYELRVLEVNPNGAASIIECDMRVDFAPAVGYEEPPKPQEKPASAEESEDLYPAAGFVTFGGSGNRLDGKNSSQEAPKAKVAQVGIPDYDWQLGFLKFPRGPFVTENKENQPAPSEPLPFAGLGNSLRKK